MIWIGSHNEFYFLQTAEEGIDFRRLVEEFSEFLIGQSVAVLSFDGDSMKPTELEIKRGWKYDQAEVAYFDALNSFELKTNVFANCYDEWYLFDEPEKVKSNNIFVINSGLSLVSSKDNMLKNSLRLNFWKQIELNAPNKFILYGDNFIYGTKNKNEINELKLAWTR